MQKEESFRYTLVGDYWHGEAARGPTRTGHVIGLRIILFSLVGPELEVIDQFVIVLG